MESAMFSRRRMLLGCITLGAALALCVGIQALFGWGRAQLDTGAALSADTLRLHIRAASDTIADQTAKLAVRDASAGLSGRPLHRLHSARSPRVGCRTPARLAACRRRGAGAAGQFCTGAGAVGGNVLRYHPVSHRRSARRAVSRLCGSTLARHPTAGTGGACSTRVSAGLPAGATPPLPKTTSSAGTTFSGSGWWTGRTG